MNNISVKLDERLEKKLSSTARTTGISQSELIRRALTHYLDQQASPGEFKSAADLAGDLAGCVAGGPADLAENPEYLDDFGR